MRPNPPVSLWCFVHDAKRVVCGCPVLPRSGIPDSLQPVPMFSRSITMLRRADWLMLLFVFILTFGTVTAAQAGENWKAKVMNGPTQMGRCSVPLGDVFKCASSVIFDLNTALGTGIATASSYKLVSRSADVMSATVGGSVSIVVDTPGTSANATYTVVTEESGSAAMEVSFMVFLLGLVLCFGVGWIAGYQR